MKRTAFFFKTVLLALFTLSVLTGAIAADYFWRHEITSKAKRYLAANDIALSPDSAVDAASNGKLEVLNNLKNAELDLGSADRSGVTPLLAAVSKDQPTSIDFLLGNQQVINTIDFQSPQNQTTPLSQALSSRRFPIADKLIQAGASLNVDKEAGLPLLIHSIQEEDDEMFRYLLNQGAHVGYRGAQTASPLALASHLGRTNMISSLLEKGASPDDLGVSGVPLLIESVQEENIEQFNTLLKAGANVDIPQPGQSNSLPLTPLSHAVAKNNVAMQDALLQAKANTHVAGLSGEPLIYELTTEGNRETLKRLLEHQADTEVLSSLNISPLAAATANDDLATVSILLSHQADPSFAAKGSNTPLQIAVDRGNTVMVNQLLAAGAKYDSSDLLGRAYTNRDDPTLHLLLSHGANPEAVFPGTKERIFDRAIREGAPGAVRTLLGGGAKIGDNLWAALLTGQDDLIRLILNAGGDPRQKGPNGEDPLAYCLTHHRTNAAKDLIAGGADPNARYDEQDTWLTKSVREGNEEIALALVEAGAEVEGVKARDGHTLLGWSIARRTDDLTHALIKAGVDLNGEEQVPARKDFQDCFDSNTFKYHLQVDKGIKPVMLAAAHRDAKILQALIDAGARSNAFTRRYLSAATIGAWYKDVKIQQLGLIGRTYDVQPKRVVVSLSRQRVTLYENGVATFNASCSTGRSGKRTPKGEFVISDRHRHHTSSIYGASMPFFQRFSFSAIGLHEGHLPGYPASAGCIRLSHSSAQFLFGKLNVGDYAVIVD